MLMLLTPERIKTLKQGIIDMRNIYHQLFSFFMVAGLQKTDIAEAAFRDYDYCKEQTVTGNLLVYNYFTKLSTNLLETEMWLREFHKDTPMHHILEKYNESNTDEDYKELRAQKIAILNKESKAFAVEGHTPKDVLDKVYQLGRAIKQDTTKEVIVARQVYVLSTMSELHARLAVLRLRNKLLLQSDGLEDPEQFSELDPKLLWYKNEELIIKLTTFEDAIHSICSELNTFITNNLGEDE